MFPGIDGFHWTAGHLIFLGLFYSVALVILATLSVAGWRALRDLGAQKADAIRWQGDFHDLPEADRTCRHVLTGEFQHRTCELGFDCRRCVTHAALLKKHPPVEVSAKEVEEAGVRLPLDRLYHRGHAWVRPEADGTVTVGLDAVAAKLVGKPEAVKLPSPGARLLVNGTGWRLWKRGSEIRVLSPVEGMVVATGGPESDWYLKVRPAGGQLDARHLLRPDEVRPWLGREMERLQLAVSGGRLRGSLADGGTLVEDFPAAVSEEQWENICAEIFLQV